MATRLKRRSERGRLAPPEIPEPQADAAPKMVIVRPSLPPEIAPSDSLRMRGTPLIPASLRSDMIRDAAYFRAQARAFAPGEELSDWLAAEEEIDDLIVCRYGR
jgi:Protein of unknown function (DUF2934)